MLLSADMDAFKLKDFRERFPDQFLNVGVSEQNMINVAAGLALAGKKVFCYSIAAFATLRCFEQVKIHIGSMNLPVTIVGAGAGFSFGYDGPTHHGHQDLSSMRLIPEMEIIELSSNDLAEKAVISLTQKPRPSYIRLDKGPFPTFKEPKFEFSEGSRSLADPSGQEIVIVSNGYMMRVAQELRELLLGSGIDSGLIDLFVVHPINLSAIDSVTKSAKLVVSVEESCTRGGLGTALLEAREEIEGIWDLLIVGSPNQQFIEYGSRDWFHEKYGLTSGNIFKEVVRKLKRESLS